MSWNKKLCFLLDRKRDQSVSEPSQNKTVLLRDRKRRTARAPPPPKVSKMFVQFCVQNVCPILSIFCPKLCPFFCPFFCWKGGGYPRGRPPPTPVGGGGTPGGAPSSPQLGGGVPPGAPPPPVGGGVPPGAAPPPVGGGGGTPGGAPPQLMGGYPRGRPPPPVRGGTPGGAPPVGGGGTPGGAPPSSGGGGVPPGAPPPKLEGGTPGGAPPPPPSWGGGPPCGQTNWKHYLPVILRMRAVKIRSSRFWKGFIFISCMYYVSIEVSLKYDLINFVKSVSQKYLTLTKLWRELNLGPRITSLMPYQIGHRGFCSGCASNNQQFHVLLCFTGFVKFS